MTLTEFFQGLYLPKIEAMIQNGQEENLTLDFKRVNRSDLSQSDDKKNLAKALSGFANSSGGLIIWGIDARKNADGVDCASGSIPIDNLPLFVSRLNELTGSATSPIVDRVEHKAILTEGDKGYAVTFVPESLSPPHMAKFSEDRYFKRSGDSFYRLEHFDLEDMFGRRQKPLLTVEADLSRDSRRTLVHLSLVNSGRGIAIAPYLSFEMPEGFQLYEYGVDGNGNEGLPRIIRARFGHNPTYGAQATIVIHPGVSREITAIKLRDGATFDGQVIINYQVTAQGVSIRSDSLKLTG